MIGVDYMKEWTYRAVWEVTGKSAHYIRVTHKVLAHDEQSAAERAFRWFMDYHKKSFHDPIKAFYIGMQLMEVKDA